MSLTAEGRRSVVGLPNPSPGKASPSITYNRLEEDENPARSSPWSTKAQSTLRRKRWWPRELFAWTTSTLLLAALLATVAVYDHRHTSESLGVHTLNTLIAIISAFVTILLLVPLISCFGQARWNSALQPRSLHDLYHIGQAGRSPQGSLMLLLRGKGGFMAISSVLLTLSIFTIGPFLQQLISFEPSSRAVRDAGVTIPVLRNMTPETHSEGSEQITIQPSTQRAFIRGLNTSGKGQFPVPSTCTAESCGFYTYSTLGFCSSCQNVTSQIQKVSSQSGDGSSQTWMIPGNGQVLQQGVNATVFNGTAIGVVTGHTDYAGLGVNFTAIAYDNDTINTPIATQCSLQVCSRMIIANIANGHLSEMTQFSSTVGLKKENTLLFPTMSSFVASLPTDVGNYTVDIGWATALADWAAHTITGTLQATSETDPHHQTTNSNSQVDGPMELQAMYDSLLGRDEATPINVLFSNIAESLTSNMRTGDVFPNYTVTGYHEVPDPILMVNLVWFIAPLLIDFLVLVLLICVIIDTNRKQMWRWRDGGLATVCHGLEGDSADAFAALLRNGNTEETARNLPVQLAEDNGRLRLVIA